MRPNIYLAIVFVGAFSQGCVTMYKVPAGTPTASVTFATTANGVRVQAFEDVTCKASPYGTRVAYFFLSMADPHTGVEKRIAADKLFVYTFAMDDGVSTANTCAITTTFQPQPNQKYKAEFHGAGIKCTASLFRVNEGGSGAEALVPEPSAQQTMAPCVNRLTD